MTRESSSLSVYVGTIMKFLSAPKVEEMGELAILGDILKLTYLQVQRD